MPVFSSSLLTEADAGHTEFTDEVYQNETRFPGGEWKPAAEPYTDVVGHAFIHTLSFWDTVWEMWLEITKFIYAYL